MKKGKNTEFIYIYRDGANYKAHGSVIFAGPLSERRKKKILSEGDEFVAHSVRVPEVFLYMDGGYGYDEETDHCFHEAYEVLDTQKDPDDEHGRKVDEFFKEFMEKKDEGVFDPLERWPGLNDYTKGAKNAG